MRKADTNNEHNSQRRSSGNRKTLALNELALKGANTRAHQIDHSDANPFVSILDRTFMDRWRFNYGTACNTFGMQNISFCEPLHRVTVYVRSLTWEELAVVCVTTQVTSRKLYIPSL